MSGKHPAPALPGEQLAIAWQTASLLLDYPDEGLLARLLYGTGMRLMEGIRLRVKDVDLERREIIVRHGKGGRDREIPLSPTLLTALRQYYRWMRPKTYLFPGTRHGWRADTPIRPPPACRESSWNAASRCGACP